MRNRYGKLEHKLKTWLINSDIEIDKNLCFPTSILSEAVFQNEKDSFLLGKTVLWIFFIDDIIDDNIMTESKCSIFVNEFVSFTSSKDFSSVGYCNDYRRVFHIFNEIKGEILSYSDHSDFKNWMGLSIKMVDSMIREKMVDSFKGIDDYLEVGEHSIGAPLTVMTIAIIDRKKRRAKSNNYWKIELISKDFGRAIRIYNDLKTYKREESEKKQNIFKVLNRINAIINRKELIEVASSYLRSASDKNKSLNLRKGLRRKLNNLFEVSSKIYSIDDFRYFSKQSYVFQKKKNK